MGGVESKEEEIVSKNDLTKELEKTSMMSKEEKMSISKLKSLMNVDSEESDEEDMPIAKKRKRGRPKTPNKGKVKKKKDAKKSPKISPSSVGPRRSRRLEKEETVNSDEAEGGKEFLDLSDEPEERNTKRKKRV